MSQTLHVGEHTAIVPTTAGRVRGCIRNGIYSYRGIPYGADTAGDARFLPPKKPLPWSTTRNALFWGPSSAHPFQSSEKANDFEPFSGLFTFHFNNFYTGENCLTINVWTPSIEDQQRRPVLLWLHGGGYEFGSSMNMDAYVGENLSRTGDVVVCSVNHRLGPFGLLDLSEVGGDHFADSANVGMQDLVLALEWIRDNIHAFGGDANNVTLFGQSGGGAKAAILMAMPKAKGLFHKVATMSGTGLRVESKEQAQRLARTVVKQLGHDSNGLSRLQNMPWEACYQLVNDAKRTLLKEDGISVSEPYLGWSPNVDGVHLPQHPFDPAAPLISAGIPMLVGSCMNESSPSANAPQWENIDLAGVIQKLEGTHGGKARTLVEAYAQAFPSRKPIEIWSMLLSPRTEQVQQAERQTANGGRVYCYWFAWQTPLYDGRPRAYHSSDIPFWFHNTDIMDTMTGGGERPRTLAERMSQALVHFARSGNPHHTGLPEWPAFSTDRGEVMLLDDECVVMADPDRLGRRLLERG